jgi:hypothetical protein
MTDPIRTGAVLGAGATAALGLVLLLGAGPAGAEEETIIEHYKTESHQMKVETVPVRPTPSPIVEQRTKVIVPPMVEKRTTTETVEED